MMTIDPSLFITVTISFLTFMGFILRYVATGVKCLVELKVTVEQIKITQKEIKEDFDKLEDRVLKYE